MSKRLLSLLAMALAATVLTLVNCQAAEQAATAPATTPVTAPATAPEYPSAAIRRGELVMELYLPDAESGYYRGTRFDWSGMIARVKHKGHTFFGVDWKSPHNPATHDHGIGVPEEFGMESPLGWDDAKEGETFIKIGVGLLKKPPGDAKYKFNGKYELVQPGKWQITQAADSVAFRQQLSNDRGYGYDYTKKIELTDKGFVVRHSLKNTGTKPIDTDVYSHNFIIIDEAPIGPDYVVLLPPGMAEQTHKSGLAAVTNNTIRFLGEVPKGKAVWLGLIAADAPEEARSAERNAAVVANRKTNGWMALQGDRPLIKYAFYAERTAACPEPFVAIKVEPGKETSWETTYTVGGAGEM